MPPEVKGKLVSKINKMKTNPQRKENGSKTCIRLWTHEYSTKAPPIQVPTTMEWGRKMLARCPLALQHLQQRPLCVWVVKRVNEWIKIKTEKWSIWIHKSGLRENVSVKKILWKYTRNKMIRINKHLTDLLKNYHIIKLASSNDFHIIISLFLNY